MFNKIDRPVRIYQEVADKIEEAILAGELKAGDRLPAERDLAETFDISRRTLRESLRVVEQKGLVEIRNTGAVVRMATREKAAQSLSLAIRSQQIAWVDIAQFRVELDAIIGVRALQAATPENISRLEEMLTDAEALLAAREVDWDGYLDIDKRFHIQLARMTGNPVYEIILITFLDNLRRYFDAYRHKEREFCLDNLENMRSTVQAIKNGDIEAIRSLAADHVKLGSIYRGEAGPGGSGWD